MKDNILNKACDKFLKDGYSNVNMDDISRELGISKKTLYDHFESKKGLFQSCANKIVTKHVEQAKTLQERMTKDGDFHFLDEMINLWDLIAEHITVFKPRFIEDIKRYSPESWEICGENDENKRKFFNKIFDLGKQKGFIRKNINRNVFFMMYVNSIHSVIKLEVLSELSLNSKQALHMIFEILFQGSLTEHGNQEFNKVINNNRSVSK
ncbi:TetR/AcrR family transcriptional regulator [Candidatus Kapabacteria bacterium]|nr:TetR/AcrR family transcriptional regulator [Candidatus Kapabacteria bacterium]